MKSNLIFEKVSFINKKIPRYIHQRTSEHAQRFHGRYQALEYIRELMDASDTVCLEIL